MKARHLTLLCATALILTGCGGTKLIKQAAPVPQLERPLAAAADTNVAAELEFVVVRNGPGAWARNASWDEYLLRLRNLGTTQIRIDAITLVDGQGHESTTYADRSDLVSASKQTARRYRAEGLEVEAGRGGGMLVAAGVGAGVIGYGAAVAATTSAALGAGGAAGGGAAAAAGGMFLAAPVLIGVGVARMVNNSKVDDRIETRATALPLPLAPGADVKLDVFFPISPSPQRLVVHYHDGTGLQRLAVDTRQALDGLHLAAAADPVSR